MCHSERSAEDRRMAMSKTKNLHAVELFMHGLVQKKRELTSGIFERSRRAKTPHPYVSLHFVRVCSANIAERSAEDKRRSSGKTMNLHAVELFWNGSVTKKRELASGIFERSRRA